jgi:integration host factor subunit alpha
MTKLKLSKIVSEKTGLSIEQSKDIVSTFFETKINILKTNNLKIHKFGTYSKSLSPKRIGRNPKTMEEFVIKSKTRISFIVSSKVKDLLN